MSTHYRIEYGQEKQHAANLAAGLLMLGPEFNARICPMCTGEGQHEQTYTAGCGGGYFKSMGPCDYCKGHGLLQGVESAPASVVTQVVNAGVSFLGVENENSPVCDPINRSHRHNRKCDDWMR